MGSPDVHSPSVPTTQTLHTHTDTHTRAHAHTQTHTQTLTQTQTQTQTQKRTLEHARARCLSKNHFARAKTCKQRT